MNLSEIKQKMFNQEFYKPEHPDLMAEQFKHLDKLHAFNQLKATDIKARRSMLKKMFAQVGDNCYIEGQLQANWGGKHVYFGDNIYANFNLTLVDDGEIYVDDDVMIGPNVTLCTATHPIDPILRRDKIQYNLPVHIEENVWIGANTMVLPGVTIGKNSVIGAGSNVTKNIPENVLAHGNPCRVIRHINE